MESIWNAEMPQRQALNQEIKADVAVIGAGMAGILCAYLLSEQGVNVVVLEATRTATGITKNTTAKITSQHDLIYDKLIKDFGQEKAAMYADANEQAVNRYRGIIEQNNIDCSFENTSAFLYTKENPEKLENEAEAALKLGIKASIIKDTELPFKVESALEFSGQAQFHPLKFIKEVSKNLTIYEQTMVRKVEDNVVYTDQGKVIADKIIVATHYPFINVPGYYFIRLYQERSYVIALENAQKISGMYLGIDSNNAYSFRSYDNFLIFGGESHKTGKNYEGGCYERLKSEAKNYYPQSNVKYQWSAQDCSSLDSVPYIGAYSASTPNLYVATGFKKWGMTSSMVAAMILTDDITGKDNPNREIFSPQRFEMTASLKHLASNTIEATKGLSSTAFHVPSSAVTELPNGHGGIVKYEGRKLGVYKSESGEIFTINPKCTHLGCELSWNPDELSWDCPCHGSRFDYRGNLIDNPAMKGLDLV